MSPVTAIEKLALLNAVPPYSHQDEALADLATFSDWLASECFCIHNANTTNLQFQFRMAGEAFDEGAFQLALDMATPAQLLHVFLECCVERRAFLAMRELKARYLRAQGFTA